jgi:hypothetical protein
MIIVKSRRTGGAENVGLLCRKIEDKRQLWIYRRRWEDKKQNKTNSVALVQERTIPTERPPLIGEVSANFCGYKVSRGQ